MNRRAFLATRGCREVAMMEAVSAASVTWQETELAERRVVAADGSIWLCDLAYGIGGYCERIKAEPEQEKENRVDPKSGDSRL
jgi:hypothetical protein